MGTAPASGAANGALAVGTAGFADLLPSAWPAEVRMIPINLA